MSGSSGFTAKEKQQFRMRKYIKEHCFDFVLSLVGNILLVVLVLYFCGGQNYGLGVLLAAVYTAGRAAADLRWYKKDYLEKHPDTQR